MSVKQLRDVRIPQLAQQDWAAAAGDVWSSADTLWPFLSEKTNHVRAARMVRWSDLLPEDATVLDLACGSGWLAGLLSAQPRVASVLAWDSSPHLLSELLPPMVDLAGGDMAKIEPVCGDFTPLLLDDDSIDAVVMSSAFHHAASPDVLLAEVRRVLHPAGVLVLLNETPWYPIRLFVFATRHYLSTVLGLVGLPGPKAPGALTGDGALYDIDLGDRAYTLRSWGRIAARNGWSMQVLATGLPPYPAHFRRRAFLEPDLTHLVMRPLARA